MFGAHHVRNWQEWKDEQDYPYDSVAALAAYSNLKSGAGDGIPYADGDIPLNVWRFLQTNGSAGTDGRIRKIESYYQLDKTAEQTEQEWLDLFFNTILLYGPVTVATAWPNNWFVNPAPSGVMPNPGGSSTGHMFSVSGKRTINGVICAACDQSWIDWGVIDPNGDTNVFYIPVDMFAMTAQLGLWECWKTFDVLGDHPVIPIPPKPQPESGMLSIYTVDPVYLDLAIGTQLYKEDGSPLTTVHSGGSHLFSPGLANATHRAVAISTGGVRQYALVAITDCKNVVSLDEDWLHWLSMAPKS